MFLFLLLLYDVSLIFNRHFGKGHCQVQPATGQLLFLRLAADPGSRCFLQNAMELPRQFGAAAFPAVTEFAAQCKAAGLNVVMTVVDVIGEESIRECEKLCQGLGVPLRVRKYVADNYDGSVDTDGK